VVGEEVVVDEVVESVGMEGVVLCVVVPLRVVMNVLELLECAKTPVTPATMAAMMITTMITTAITTLPSARLSPNLGLDHPFLNRLAEHNRLTSENRSDRGETRS